MSNRDQGLFFFPIAVVMVALVYVAIGLIGVTISDWLRRPRKDKRKGREAVAREASKDDE